MKYESTQLRTLLILLWKIKTKAVSSVKEKEQRIKKNKVKIFMKMFLKSPRQKVEFCQYKPLKKNEANKLVKSHEVRFHLVYVYVLAVSCTGYILFH